MGAHYERARLLFGQKRYELAERELREELAENPNHGQAHAFLGRCLAMQKRLPEALEAGVRLAPHLAYTHSMLGHTYSDCGRLAEAEESMREGLRLNPRSPSQLEALSWVQFQRGDRLGALATVEQGLAIDPEHVGCLNYRAQLKRVLGKWSDAEETLRQSLQLAPESDFAHANLAWALYSKAIARARAERKATSWPWRPEIAEALQHCQEALRLNPGSEFARKAAVEILKAPLLVRFVLVGTVVGGVVLVLFLYLIFSGMCAGGELKQYSSADRVLNGLLLVLCGVMTLCLSAGPQYLLMRRSRLGRACLSPARQWAANGTLLCLAAAAVAAVAAAFTFSPPTAFAAFFLVLAFIQPMTVACETAPGWPRRFMVAYCTMLAATGLACLAALCRGDPGRLSPAVVVLAVGVTVASVLSFKTGEALQRRFRSRRG